MKFNVPVSVISQQPGIEVSSIHALQLFDKLCFQGEVKESSVLFIQVGAAALAIV